MNLRFLMKLSIIVKIFPFILENSFYRTIRLYLLYYIKRNQKWGWDTTGFYRQNTERANAVSNMLADEKSKKIYLGMTKFRQTRCKKDYPFHVVNEEQYFLKELKFDKDEIFIDCGAYTGDTIDQFFKHCREYEKIVALDNMIV